MRGPPEEPPSLYVIAGVNGAGKSSVAGAAIRERGFDYFNPDEAARRIRDASPGIDFRRANSEGWLQGKRLLERAIASRFNFAFETTLGGNTIASMLESAHDAGLAVRVWYFGLDGPELHIARVRRWAEAGGHDIPEALIRRRYDRSRENLIRLLPKLAELRVFDNSAEGEPKSGSSPRPRLILYVLDREIHQACELNEVPHWAKPVFLAALRQYAT